MMRHMADDHKVGGSMAAFAADIRQIRSRRRAVEDKQSFFKTQRALKSVSVKPRAAMPPLIAMGCARLHTAQQSTAKDCEYL
jgi:hypothetical protein